MPGISLLTCPIYEGEITDKGLMREAMRKYHNTWKTISGLFLLMSEMCLNSIYFSNDLGINVK
jgi:hypothetical protein